MIDLKVGMRFLLRRNDTLGGFCHLDQTEKSHKGEVRLFLLF